MAPLEQAGGAKLRGLSITTHKIATGLIPRASFQRASVKLVPVLELILVSMSRLGDSWPECRAKDAKPSNTLLGSSPDFILARDRISLRVRARRLRAWVRLA